jgi:hypothetical protein
MKKNNPIAKSTERIKVEVRTVLLFIGAVGGSVEKVAGVRSVASVRRSLIVELTRPLNHYSLNH